jgi:putative ABC transport system permease protein
MQGLKADLVQSVRRLIRTPLFTAAAIATLALGVGVNTALFSVVNAVLLKSSPSFSSPGLVALCVREDGQLHPERMLYTEWVRRVREGASDAVYRLGTVRTFRGTLSTEGGASIAKGEAVSDEYFAALGTRPTLGRLLGPADDAPTAPDVAVLSEGLWRRMYGSDTGIVGRTVRLRGQLLTVVGVVASEYRGFVLGNLLATDVWIPRRSCADMCARPDGLSAVARLKDGVSHQRANAMVQAATHNVDPSRPDVTIGLLPLSSAVFSGPPTFYLAGLALMGLAALVVFIACANLTNLLLARLSSRTAELAVRQALGAGGSRLLQLLGAETGLLSIVGGGLGVLIAVGATKLMTSIPLPARGGHVAQIDAALDWRVFGYALATVLVATFTITAALARRAAAVDGLAALSSAAGSGGATDARTWVRSNLIAAQMAAAVVLLMGAALLVQATLRELNWDAGLDTTHVALGDIDHSLEGFEESAGRAANREILDALDRVPGVTVAALASELPGSRNAVGVRLVDAARFSGGAGAAARLIKVSPRFFDALGVPAQIGRGFLTSDHAAAQPVAVLNESAAAALWPGLNPVGRSLEATLDGGERRVLHVVGVVADVRVRSDNPRDRRVVFVPLDQSYASRVTVVVRGTMSDVGLGQALRETARRTTPGVAVYDVRTLTEHVAGTASSLRLAASLLSVLGALGMAVACVGLYGVVACSMTSRSREFGIMKALGASHRDIYRLTLRQFIPVLLKGIVPGLVVGWALSAVLRSFIVTVQPFDPIVLVVPGVLCVVALAAILLPLHRTLGAEPAAALRRF